MKTKPEFHCLTCEKLKETTVAEVRVPCNLLVCENQQRTTGQTLCNALNLAACAKR